MKVAILSGSVYGAAEEVARHAEQLLKRQDIQAWHNPRTTLQDVLAFAPEAVLAVTSTTGMGELPDNIMALYAQLRDELPAALQALPSLPLIALHPFDASTPAKIVAAAVAAAAGKFG